MLSAARPNARTWQPSTVRDMQSPEAAGLSDASCLSDALRPCTKVYDQDTRHGQPVPDPAMAPWILSPTYLPLLYTAVIAGPAGQRARPCWAAWGAWGPACANVRTYQEQRLFLHLAAMIIFPLYPL